MDTSTGRTKSSKPARAASTASARRNTRSGSGFSKRVANQAKSYLQDELTRRRSKSAGDLEALASSLQRMSRELNGNPASPYVEELAGRLERLSELVESADLRELASATERFARQEPWLFLGGLFVLGLGSARLVKSTVGAATRGEQREHATRTAARA